MSRPLLVMPCSARKNPAPGLTPARDRYDGSPWRTLRANRAGLELDVLVLSAAHGFIREQLPIADYDRRLDKARAAELLGDISAPWFRRQVEDAGRLFFMGSGLYRGVMHEASGGGFYYQRPHRRQRGDGSSREPSIGEQLSDLKAWLNSLRQDLSC